MVATMSKLAFVTGEARIAPASLTPTEWVFVVNKAKGYVTLEYLQGLKSLRQILEKEDFRRVVKPCNISNLLPRDIQPNAVYCHLAGIVGAPSSKNCFAFDEVPSEEYPKLSDLVARPYQQETVLLSKRGDFCLLKAEWLLKEEERDYGRTLPSYECWCELQKIELRVLADADLELLFGGHPEVPMHVLSRLFLAQRETNMSLEARSRGGKIRAQKLEDILKRLGVPL